MKVQEARESDTKKIIEKSGHHEPNTQRYHRGCGCEGETKGGNAYRDLVIEYETNGGDTATERFYHQSRVITVYRNEGAIRKVDVNTHGYGGSSATRERINKELPDGFRMTQKDDIPMLELPSGDVVDVPQRFTILYDELEDGWVRVANWDGSKPVVDVTRE